MNSKLIQALIDFSEGKKVKSFGGEKTEIRHSTIWNKFERVWNNGMGIITFAQIDNGMLLINSPYCSEKELKDIKNNLKIPFELVALQYPDYYQYDLIGVRNKNKVKIN